MPLDENTLIVKYAGQELQVPAKVAGVAGEFKRTEPGCFRKEGGGKLHFNGGYWYLVDRLGQQVAYVEGEKQRVPDKNWQQKVESTFGFGGSEDVQISVTPKEIEIGDVQGQEKETGCSDWCSQKWGEIKAKVPEQHRDKVTNLEASVSARVDSVRELKDKHVPLVKAKTKEHMDTAKGYYNEVAPYVKQYSKEGYNACHEFWTHPDTVECLRATAIASKDGAKCCLAGCLALLALCLDAVTGGAPKKEKDEALRQEDDSFEKPEAPDVVVMDAIPSDGPPTTTIPSGPPTTTIPTNSVA